MSVRELKHNAERPAGYAALIEWFKIMAPPPWHKSVIAERGGPQRTVLNEFVYEVYPRSYWPGDGVVEHLEFALKYDGVNLALLAEIFARADIEEITGWIKSKPTGKYARCIWYLYEFLSGDHLPLDDVKPCGYVNLLDAERYVTSNSPLAVPRQRIKDNLLGNAKFCPVIRRTPVLEKWIAGTLARRCHDLAEKYPAETFRRALGYLYTKETKSSFEIENITPDAARTERYVTLLQLAEREDFCAKAKLIELQTRIVDSRFAAADYRTVQNYIGESVRIGRQRVHYVCPKPGDVHGLMEGLIACHQRLAAGGVHPVLHATLIGYGFVYVHPFEDGNGRIHRFLIHNILAQRKFSPSGFILPVSAAMLHDPAAYDRSLEAFSRAIQPFLEYSLDEQGVMTVSGDTSRWYRYMDMTNQAEALFDFIERALEYELPDELDFVASYDRAKNRIQAIIDLPDRRLDTFIRLCLVNAGRLSATKRRSHFNGLTDDEINAMEQVVQAEFKSHNKL